MTKRNDQDLEARLDRALAPRVKRTKRSSGPAALLALIEGEDEPARSQIRATVEQIRATFALMAVAEEVLDARWPRRSAPQAAFMLLLPTEPVRIGQRLYRAHVNELVERMAERAADSSAWKPADWNALECLTRAEVLGIMSAAAGRHPLGHDDVLLFETLLRRTFSPEELGASLAGMERHDYGPQRRAEVERSVTEWLARKSPERAETIAKLRKEEP